MSPEFECKYLFVMGETVKTSEVTHTHLHTVDCVAHLPVGHSKTPYIPKIKGNKLNCFTKEWSTKQTKHINNLNTKIKKKQIQEYIVQNQK